MARARWAGTVSAQDETDAILDQLSGLLSIQSKHTQGSNVADRSSQFQTKETTLHYIVGDQEKEMEYRQWGALVLYISRNLKMCLFRRVVYVFIFSTCYL